MGELAFARLELLEPFEDDVPKGPVISVPINAPNFTDKSVKSVNELCSVFTIYFINSVLRFYCISLFKGRLGTLRGGTKHATCLVA